MIVCTFRCGGNAHSKGVEYETRLVGRVRVGMVVVAERVWVRPEARLVIECLDGRQEGCFGVLGGSECVGDAKDVGEEAGVCSRLRWRASGSE